MTKINLDGVVGWDIIPSEVSRALDEAEGDIVFEMNSPGGYITDGMAIMNKIKSYNKGSITANITYAASMMTQIASACDHINCYENAVYMIHNAQGLGYGDHHNVRRAANRLESFSNMLANNYVKQSGIAKEEILTMMDDETYLFGQEIIDKGFATNIIDSDSEIDEESAKALASDQFNNYLMKLKEKDENEEAVAAILGDFDNNLDKNIEIKEKDDIIDDEIKNQGDSVEKEFTQEDIDNSVASDRVRISAIMDIDCSDEMKTNAINNGTSAGDLALEVLAEQKKEKDVNKQKFVNAASGADVEVADPAPEMSEEDKKTEEALAALEGDE